MAQLNVERRLAAAAACCCRQAELACCYPTGLSLQQQPQEMSCGAAHAGCCRCCSAATGAVLCTLDQLAVLHMLQAAAAGSRGCGSGAEHWRAVVRKPAAALCRGGQQTGQCWPQYAWRWRPPAGCRRRPSARRPSVGQAEAPQTAPRGAQTLEPAARGSHHASSGLDPVRRRSPSREVFSWLGPAPAPPAEEAR